MSEKYRAETSHLIDGKQVNKTTTFWSASKKAAQDKFRGLRKTDPTIQEAGLFRARDNELVAEYIGYV